MRDKAIETLDLLRARAAAVESEATQHGRYAALAADIGDDASADALLSMARTLRVRALLVRGRLAALRADCLLAYPGIRVPGDA